MVYLGKPSRGCQSCKSRRIKCDEARPACGNCKKSGRECPGYPDEFDLIFRNETPAVKRRAQKATASRSRANTNISNATSASGSEKSDSPKSLELSPAVSQDLVPAVSPGGGVTEAFASQSLKVGDFFQRAAENPDFPLLDAGLRSPGTWTSTAPNVGLEYSREATSVSFFFRNFAVVPQQNACSRGFLEYLVPMYNTAPSDSALQLATHAVCLSALSQYPGNRRLKTDARQAYGLALQRVNHAIRAGPPVACSDEILLTVLLFSLYEVVHGEPSAIPSSSSTDTAWSNHIDGAVALAKLRGGDGWNTPESLGLFRAVRTCMVTNAIQRGARVDEFPGAKGWWCDDAFETTAANRLTLISLGLPNMRRLAHEIAVLTPGPDKDSQLQGLVKMAQDIDGQFESWYLTLEEEWGYQTVGMQLDEPDDVYSATRWLGPVHAYRDLFYANIINDYRVSRIFCHQIILSASAMMTSSDTEGVVRDLQRTGVYNVCSMADDICSSVPFHLEVELQPEAQARGQDLHATEATGGYFLTYPLYVLMGLEYIPVKQREWIKGRLYRIASGFGLDHSQIVTVAERQVLSNGPKFP